jgi:hypothetical protein
MLGQKGRRGEGIKGKSMAGRRKNENKLSKIYKYNQTDTNIILGRTEDATSILMHRDPNSANGGNEKTTYSKFNQYD